jgi:hypothetical protein
MVILPKAIYMFSTIPNKIPMTILRDRKINPKIHLEAQDNIEQNKQH